MGSCPSGPSAAGLALNHTGLPTCPSDAPTCKSSLPTGQPHCLSGQGFVSSGVDNSLALNAQELPGLPKHKTCYVRKSEVCLNSKLSWDHPRVRLEFFPPNKHPKHFMVPYASDTSPAPSEPEWLILVQKTEGGKSC